MTSGPDQPGSTADVAAALARERPDLRVASISPLGEGVKSDVWRIRADGAPDFALKVFKPEYHGAERTEIAFHETLGDAHDQLDGVIPRLLFASEEVPPMLAATLLEGEQLLNAKRVGRAELSAIYRRMGAALAVIHRIPMSGFGQLPLGGDKTFESNTHFMTDRWLRIWTEFREHGGDDHLARCARRYLEEREELWDTCGPPVLCHGDAHPGNVLVTREAGGVRFAGMLDFESATATDPVFDFAAACTTLVSDHKGIADAIAQGHGEPEGPWRERLEMYALVNALSDWGFYAKYVARTPQRKCERRIFEITGTSRLHVWRSGVRRRLGGRRDGRTGG